MIVVKMVDALPALVPLDHKTYSQQSAAAAAAAIRDPHDLPEFSTQNVPAAPILYLPPLLSKLPDGLAHSPIPSPENPPLSTDTRLPNIDPVSLSLHKALHHFSPRSPEYSSTPYAEAFNWSDLQLPEHEEREWYCVVFRSKRRAGSDSGPLYEADRLAHEEAVQNGGLIMYWYGVPDADGYNLATCIWQSRRHAVAANSRPYHITAMRLAAASFETYILERHVLRKTAGVKELTVERYTAGDVGW